MDFHGVSASKGDDREGLLVILNSRLPVSWQFVQGLVHKGSPEERMPGKTSPALGSPPHCEKKPTPL